MRAGPAQILRLIAFGLGALAAIAAALEFVDTLAPERAPAPAVTADPLAAELARCRTLGLEEAAGDIACRRAWAENRRRFFGSSADTPATE
jgi:conjugative transfer region protein TrbK